MDDKTVLSNSGNRSTQIVSLEVLVRDAVALGCVTEKEFSTIAPTHSGTSNENETIAIAKEMVRQGRLTSFQAQVILTGNARGLTLGPYLVLDKIGQGGMGSVYRARHQHMQRIVAIKVLSVHGPSAAELIKRFHRETQAAAKLIHPNIVTAFDAGEDGKKHFLVMEYVDGQDLKSVLERSGPLSVRDAVDYTIQAARGLQYAHEQSIIHRDIKPANLLLDSTGCIKVLDMGLARISENAGLDQLSTHDLTADGTVMGTMDYMSPEQGADTRTADVRSDIYSLGCTLYTLLTREPMYPGGSLFQKITAHRENPIPSVRARRPDMPLVLERVITCMVAKKPDDRPQSMSEVIQLLESAMMNVDATVSANVAREVGSEGGTGTNNNPSNLETIIAKAGNTKLDLAKVKAPGISKGSISTIERLKAKKQSRRRNEILVVSGIAVALLVGSLGYFTVTRRTQSLAQTEKRSDKTAIQTPASSPPPPAAGGSTKPLEASTNLPAPIEPNKVPTEALAQTSSQPSSVAEAESVVPETMESKGSESTSEETLAAVADAKVALAASEPEKAVMPEAPKDIKMPDKGEAKESTLEKATGWTGWDTGKGVPQPAIVPFNAKTAAKLQEQWAKYYKVPPTFTNRIGMVFVLIPPGEFRGGFTDEELDQLVNESKGLLKREALVGQFPKHKVIIPKPYYIGVTEVTNEQFNNVLGDKPLAPNDVSANQAFDATYVQAVKFCNSLSLGHKLRPAYTYSTNLILATGESGFRLPTENEWEFAARAGSDTRYWCKPEELHVADWFLENTSGPHSVAQLVPNPFGLFDVQGYLREYVHGQDRANPDLVTLDGTWVQSIIAKDVSGTLIRGADSGTSFLMCHLSMRGSGGYEPESIWNGNVGFRVAIDVEAMRKK